MLTVPCSERKPVNALWLRCFLTLPSATRPYHELMQAMHSARAQGFHVCGSTDCGIIGLVSQKNMLSEVVSGLSKFAKPKQWQYVKLQSSPEFSYLPYLPAFLGRRNGMLPLLGSPWHRAASVFCNTFRTCLTATCKSYTYITRIHIWYHMAPVHCKPVESAALRVATLWPLMSTPANPSKQNVHETRDLKRRNGWNMEAHGETQWILKPNNSCYKSNFSPNRFTCEGFLLLLFKSGRHMVVLDALAGSFCHRFAFVSSQFSPIWLLCSMPWRRIVLPKICFHVFSFVSHMIGLLDALAGSFCHRFAFISSHFSSTCDSFARCLGRIILPKICFHIFWFLSPTWLVCWMPWPDHSAKEWLWSFFICLPHDWFAGCHGRIILPQVCIHFFSFLTHMIALLDALAGSFCHRFAFMSFHLSPTWLVCWMPWADHSATGLLSFLLICLPHAWLVCWMPWPDHSAKEWLWSFFICLPHDWFAGCLGRIILPQICFHVFSFVSHMIGLLDALAGLFCHRFAFISSHFSAIWLLCSMPWPDHFATDLLSCLFICLPHDWFAGCLGRIILPQVCFHFFSFFCHLIALLGALAGSFCLPYDCFARCLGRIILPKICFHVFSFVSHMIGLLDALAGSCCHRFAFISSHFSPIWLLCSMPWPDHLATGLLSFLLIFLPGDGFAGWLGRIILPQVCFHVFSFVSQMTALLDGLAGSFCDRFAFVSFHFFSHMIALLDALAGSFCHRFAFIFPHIVLWGFCFCCGTSRSSSSLLEQQQKHNYFTSSDPHHDISKQPR